jgi:hypothetical protein
MMESNMFEVPLICDPPPGPRYLITSDRLITVKEAAMLRAAWDDSTRRGTVLILRCWASFHIEVMPGRYEWPDAEFCAA